MRFRQLTAFVRVCQLGSITRAAAELNIAQPALGMQIRGLEAEFGAELLKRSARGVRPTAAGELVMAWSEEVLRSREDVFSKVQDGVAARGASLTVGLTPGIHAIIADRLGKWVRRERPAPMLKIVKGFSGNIVKLVEGGNLDLGLAFDIRPRSLSLRHPLLVERLYFLSAGEKSAEPIPLRDVLAQPIVLPPATDSIRKTLDDAARAIGMSVKCAMEVSSPDTAKDLAAAGLHSSVAPPASVLEAIGSGVSVRPIVSPSVSRTLYLVRRADRVVTQLERRLVDLMTSALLAFGEDDEFPPYTLAAGRTLA